MVETISAEEAMNNKDVIFIDTRSPKEFNLDHIPNAVNMPILDDLERHEVGKLYKQNQQKAFDLGFGFYKEKLDDFKKTVESFDKLKKLVVYCWRGGMRSKAVVEFIETLDVDVYQMIGGYKSYRAYMRDYLYNYKPKFKFIMLCGLAGCGKTDLIKAVAPSLDLEGLAQHRSSLFGGVGLTPRTQKKFESLLFQRLKEIENEKFVFVEGESHKVGPVYIPKPLFEAMKQGVLVKVDSSIERRVERIVRDYFTHDEDDKIKEIIKSLKVQLSNEVVDELLALMGEKDYSAVSKILLEDYYDSRYNHFIEKLKFELEVDVDDFENAVKKLLSSQVLLI